MASGLAPAAESLVLPESCFRLPGYAVDQLNSSWGFGIRIQQLGVHRWSAVKSLIFPIKAVKRDQSMLYSWALPE
jgi:hypothetical protein